MAKVKKKYINTLTIRLSDDCHSSRCCFDVLADGLQLTSCLTFGELLEFIVTIYRDYVFGNTYCEDYPHIQIRESV